METIDDIVRDMRIGDIRAIANTSSAVERKAFEYINDFLAGYADRIEVASKERESELLMKFEGAFLWILNHADLTPRACIADVPPRSIHVILDEIYVFAKTFLWELQRKENKEESMSEKKGVRPDGYKATSSSVAL